jgi:hypothetical protein
MIAKTREAQSQVIDIAIGLMEEAVDVAVPGMPGVGSLVLGQLKDEFKDHLEAQMPTPSPPRAKAPRRC